MFPFCRVSCDLTADPDLTAALGPAQPAFEHPRSRALTYQQLLAWPCLRMEPVLSEMARRHKPNAAQCAACKKFFHPAMAKHGSGSCPDCGGRLGLEVVWSCAICGQRYLDCEPGWQCSAHPVLLRVRQPSPNLSEALPDCPIPSRHHTRSRSPSMVQIGAGAQASHQKPEWQRKRDGWLEIVDERARQHAAPLLSERMFWEQLRATPQIARNPSALLQASVSTWKRVVG